MSRCHVIVYEEKKICTTFLSDERWIFFKVPSGEEVIHWETFFISYKSFSICSFRDSSGKEIGHNNRKEFFLVSPSFEKICCVRVSNNWRLATHNAQKRSETETKLGRSLSTADGL